MTESGIRKRLAKRGLKLRKDRVKVLGDINKGGYQIVTSKSGDIGGKFGYRSKGTILAGYCYQLTLEDCQGYI